MARADSGGRSLREGSAPTIASASVVLAYLFFSAAFACAHPAVCAVFGR